VLAERLGQLADRGDPQAPVGPGVGLAGVEGELGALPGGLLLAAPVAPRVVLSLLATYDADRERLGFELAQFAGQLAPLVAHIR